MTRLYNKEEERIATGETCLSTSVPLRETTTLIEA